MSHISPYNMGINDPGSHTEFHLLKNQSIIRISLNSLTGIQMLVVIFYLYQWLEIIRYAKRLIKSVWILLL